MSRQKKQNNNNLYRQKKNTEQSIKNSFPRSLKFLCMKLDSLNFRESRLLNQLWRVLMGNWKITFHTAEIPSSWANQLLANFSSSRTLETSFKKIFESPINKDFCLQLLEQVRSIGNSPRIILEEPSWFKWLNSDCSDCKSLLFAFCLIFQKPC